LPRERLSCDGDGVVRIRAENARAQASDRWRGWAGPAEAFHLLRPQKTIGGVRLAGGHVQTLRDTRQQSLDAVRRPRDTPIWKL
jgi:hypothetical protein